MLPSLGASKVVGVDRSEGMIALARAQESEHPLGIEYLVQDCRSLRLARRVRRGDSGLPAELCPEQRRVGSDGSGIARCLKPGGRFVTMNANPDLEFERGATYRKYGFEIRGSAEQQEGMPYTWVFHLDDGPVEVENYWLPATAYEEALRSAGFVEVRWHRPRISPIAEVGHEPDYLAGLLGSSPGHRDRVPPTRVTVVERDLLDEPVDMIL